MHKGDDEHIEKQRNMPPEKRTPEPSEPRKLPGTKDEIQAWLKADKQRNVDFAAFLTLMKPHAGASLVELIATFQSKRAELRPMLELVRKTVDLKAEVKRFEQKQPPPERVVECQRLMEELMDHALGLKEPYRASLMKELLPSWEALRKM